MRREVSENGAYDIYTNTMHYPKAMQPTHCRWEQLPPPPEDSDFSAWKTGYGNDREKSNGTTAPGETDSTKNTIFPPVPPAVSSKFMVVDTVFQSPPTSTFGPPGPEGSSLDIGPKGLTDVPEDVWQELPDDCKEAFLEARDEERKWKASWGTESQDKMRGNYKIAYNY